MKDNAASARIENSQYVKERGLEKFANSCVNKFRSKDFGDIDQKIAERFRVHYDVSDKDIYGIYRIDSETTGDNDIVVYYDAKKDKIFAITREEFTYFYPKDWIDRSEGEYYMAYGGNKKSTENKLGVEARTRTVKEPGLKQKEGQNREIVSEYMRKGGKNPGRELFLAHKVTPIQEYSEIVKMLTADELEQFKEVAEEVGVPLKKILQEFTYQLRVTWLPKQTAIDRTLKNARQRYFSTKDSLDEKDYPNWMNFIKNYPYAVRMLNRETGEMHVTAGYNLSNIIHGLYKENVEGKAKHPIEKILDGVDDVYEIEVIKRGGR